MESREKALEIAEAISDKKGLDVQILDVADVCSFTSFFVIATGTSPRHVKTLSDAAVVACKKGGSKVLSVEGERTGNWVLVDLGDVVVHLFREKAREFYSLERLWGEAETIELKAAGG